MKRMKHQDRATCRPLYDAGRSQKHDHTNDCDQSFHSTLEVYVIHGVEDFATQCGAEHGQWDRREDEPPAWQCAEACRLNDRNAPKSDFDDMRERLSDSLGGDDLVTRQRGVDEEQVDQWPGDARRGVECLNDKSCNLGLPLLGDVEIEQGFRYPDQHRGEAQHEVDTLRIGAPCQRKQDCDTDNRANRVAPKDRPKNMLPPKKSTIAVRDHLDCAVQDHRCGNWQENRQDAHQHHAARHAENAGQEGRCQNGDEYDCGGQNIHAARFMAQFARARQMGRRGSTEFAADLIRYPANNLHPIACLA